MSDYPDEQTLMTHIIRSKYGIVEFDKDSIAQIGPLLLDDKNTLVFIASKDFEQECTKKEYWYDIQYVNQPLRDEVKLT